MILNNLILQVLFIPFLLLNILNIYKQTNVGGYNNFNEIDNKTRREEFSPEFIDSIIDITSNTSQIHNDECVKDSEQEGEVQVCSANDIVEKFKNIFNHHENYHLADSLEQKKLYNKLYDIWNRMQTYQSNTKNKTSEIRSLLYNEFESVMLTLPLSKKCLLSLVAIGKAVKLKEEWALNCKLKILMKRL